MTTRSSPCRIGNAVIASDFDFLVNSFDCATQNTVDTVNCISFVAGGVLKRRTGCHDVPKLRE